MKKKIRIRDIIHDIIYGIRYSYKMRYYAKQAEILGEQEKYEESLEANDKLRELLEGFRLN